MQLVILCVVKIRPKVASSIVESTAQSVVQLQPATRTSVTYWHIHHASFPERYNEAVDSIHWMSSHRLRTIAILCLFHSLCHEAGFFSYSRLSILVFQQWSPFHRVSKLIVKSPWRIYTTPPFLLLQTLLKRLQSPCSSDILMCRQGWFTSSQCPHVHLEEDVDTLHMRHWHMEFHCANFFWMTLIQRKQDGQDTYQDSTTSVIESLLQGYRRDANCVNFFLGVHFTFTC